MSCEVLKTTYARMEVLRPISTEHVINRGESAYLSTIGKEVVFVISYKYYDADKSIAKAEDASV